MSNRTWPSASSRPRGCTRRCDDYDGGELGFWAPFGHIPDGLAALQDHDDLLPTSDLARAQREWAVIAPVIETLRTTPELCEL
ncbi:hypothetical protein [Mycolicibacterium holsaticum]|uniref:hypothetical protein n=1 Tax=Mycolicibacterium holsaticum TaxID=152142 RepID=UPI001C7D68FE|nr:hypothetical protein [Mycolicibacterium holsaticum]QZA13176.1 hypothetical protein K3U96_03035 [Mycolicibacterium holsaticum DSM 44478 = JCM 12374]